MKLNTCILSLGAALILAAQGAPVRAAERPALTMVDQPVRIIRGVSVFKGVVGVPLQVDDIVETGAGAAQIELTADLMIAPRCLRLGRRFFFTIS